MGLVFESKTARAVETKAIKGLGKTSGTPGRRRKLMQLAMRDGLCCHYCGNSVYFCWMVPKEYHEEHHLNSATFDHVIPKSQGGTNDVSNGILSCKRCNCARGHMSYDQFKMSIDRLGGLGTHRSLKKALRTFTSQNSIAT